MQRPPPPHQAAPADVEAGAVVLNVHGVDVAHLPVEELEHVHLLHIFIE